MRSFTSLAKPAQRSAVVGLTLLSLTGLTIGATLQVHPPSTRIASDPPAEPATRLNTRWYNDEWAPGPAQADWMARLPDDLLISELSIPGTHESHAFEGYSCWGVVEAWCSICQKLSLRGQLLGGVRALDIRLRHGGDGLVVWHGAQYLYALFADACTQEQCQCGGILNACVDFLQDHPGETILIRVKETCGGCIGFWFCTACMHCGNNTLSFAEAIEEHIARFDEDYFYFWPYTDCQALPTLGQVRGKIVILQDFQSDYYVGGEWDPAWSDVGRVSCTGDFDNDLDLDLAVIDKISDQVCLFLNSGDGALSREPPVAAPGGLPWSVCSGDFDGNGYDDLAVTLSGESKAGVILRHPAGSFPMMLYDVGDEPRDACVADFDQDGDSDLVVMNSHEGVGMASLLRNHGDGTFAPQELFEVGDHPWSVAVANLNGDAYPDLATTHLADDPGSDRYVKAFLNTGDGHFVCQWQHNVGTWGPAQVIAAQFNDPLTYVEGIVGVGRNDLGQCDVPEPNSGFVAVAGGRSHSLGLKADSSIVAWGCNDSGQCEVPEPNSGFVAVGAGVGTTGGGGDHSLGLKADGTIVAWGRNMEGQCTVPEPNADFVSIAAGAGHSLGQKADSSIVAWGDNTEGQCDVPAPNAEFVAVAGGAYHSLGLKADGSIVAWGDNTEGQCNVPEPNSDYLAVAGGAYHSLGLKSDGSIVAWGANADGQCDVPEPDTGFVAVAGGGWHTLGLKADSTIVAWGSNTYGQNCVLTQAAIATSSIAAGTEHSLVVVSGEFGPDDLAVTFPGEGQTQVFRNLGSCLSLEASINSITPKSLVAADMDNDLDPDLVVVGSGNAVTLYRNDGDFAFSELRTIGWGVLPDAVSAADFDGDFDIDLAVTEFGPFDYEKNMEIWGSDRVSIQRNQDDGVTWCPTRALGPYWKSLVLQDEFNVTDIQAKTDTIIGHLYAAWDGEPSTFYMNFLSGVNWPPGSWTCRTQPSEIAYPVNLATGEFLESYLKDGIVKRCGVVMADFPGYGMFEVVIGHNRFFDDIEVQLPGVIGSSLAWGDYDNDGDFDLLLAGDTDSGYIANVYRNDAGSFTIGAELEEGVTFSSAAWGDYDNDGDLDILLTGWTGSEKASRVYCNDAGSFAAIGAGLEGVDHGSAAWGDYDNDGDLDILLTGEGNSGYIACVYRNDAGSFMIDAELEGVASSSVAWGDYDNDGDLDILLTGEGNSGYIACVYRNDAGSFNDIDAGLEGVANSSVAWGDYDNDGDLDILVSGDTGSTYVTSVYRNDGADVFIDIDTGLPGVCNSSVAWGDRDTDGDLDILLSGETISGQIARVYLGDGSGSFALDYFWPAQVGSGSVAWGDYDKDGDSDLAVSGSTGPATDYVTCVYRNNIPNMNTRPTAPANLGEQATDSTLVFSWDAATDAETPVAGLTYNLRVGTTPGGCEICPAMADSSGNRRIAAMGNVSHNTSWTIELPDPPSPVYYWSVQALDASFQGSPFAPEQVIGVPTSVGGEAQPTPMKFALHPAVPNPFGRNTIIRYDLPEAGPVKLEVFNVIGQRVYVLLNRKMEAGRYAVVWYGQNADGLPVSLGVYFVRMEAGAFCTMRKVVRMQ